MEALIQPQRERQNRCGGSRRGQRHAVVIRGGGASGFRLHPMWRVLAWSFPTDFDRLSRTSRKRITVALSQQEHKWPSHYGDSGHGQSPAVVIRGR